ncbi:hypothetical protein IWQ60_007874 [Tieghemiomyces parasiticus]|uniref:Ribonuclease n=1 Tax=Tieghemiomyces parasiticus TaxID=78921 RepID=A0A9W8DMX5_9FUNG|nr:hypothetical protein IWQ60_007874 [Tieghemiomyces parasiticus]
MLGQLLSRKREYTVPSDLHPRQQALCDLGLPLQEPLTASWTHHSPLPRECKRDPTSTTPGPGVPFILGVDEAGRGPVLGPMVYSVCYGLAAERDAIGRLGFDDSKVLTEARRDELFDLLQTTEEQRRIGWAVRVLSPQDLSSCMLRRAKYNLNAIAHDTTIALIRETLGRGINVREIFVDTVGPPEKYQEKLTRLFPGIKIIVAKKADSLYPIVSAASICAKVVRDAVLRHWRFVELEPPLSYHCDDFEVENAMTVIPASVWSTEFGSGYPSDPATVRWLKAHLDKVFGFPGIIRFSWMTCAKMLENEGVSVTWPEEEEEVAVPAKSRSGYTTKAQLAKAQAALAKATAAAAVDPTRSVFTRVNHTDLHARNTITGRNTSASPAVQRSRLRSRDFFTSRGLQTITAVTL